jgi:DNA-nicking Smr family endonuclease
LSLIPYPLSLTPCLLAFLPSCLLAFLPYKRQKLDVPSRQYEPDPDEEQRHFDEAMADVTPLKKDHRVRVRVTAPPARTGRAAEPYRTPPTRSRDTDPDDSDGDTGYVAAGVDRRELRKLRRGQYLPGRRLDLHGLTSRSALREVKQFIETNRRAYRCVAIVHGRGLHSTGRAVLKADVRALLRGLRAVLAYTDAPRDDGGGGAVYVLLRG